MLIVRWRAVRNGRGRGVGSAGSGHAECPPEDRSQAVVGPFGAGVTRTRHEVSGEGITTPGWRPRSGRNRPMRRREKAGLADLARRQPGSHFPGRHWNARGNFSGMKWRGRLSRYEAGRWQGRDANLDSIEPIPIDPDRDTEWRNWSRRARRRGRTAPRRCGDRRSPAPLFRRGRRYRSRTPQ